MRPINWYMKRIIPLLLLLTVAATVFAQKQKPERRLVQFSGVIHNADSVANIVPYVNIVNMSDKNSGGSSNYKGYFSFVAHEQDTIRFSCVGYGNVIVIIPSNEPSQTFTVQISMKPQIANLPVFHVFPWATTEEFTKEFLSMRIADDDLAIARKNLSNASISTLEQTLPRDGSEMNSFQDFHNNVVNSHSITNPLLNPFSWGSLIRQISEGDKSRTQDTSTPQSGSTSTTGN